MQVIEAEFYVKIDERRNNIGEWLKGFYKTGHGDLLRPFL